MPLESGHAKTVQQSLISLAVGESVLRFVLVMTQSSPRVPPGVPDAGVEGVDHYVLTAHGKHQTGHRARKFLEKVDRCHLHDNAFFHQHMPINNAGDWALGRAGGDAEALQRRTGVAQSLVALSYTTGWHRA